MLEVNDFRAVRISLASPEQIRSWSYGEVSKPETINYRTLKPERDGLFCERIFGPQKDWECYCGKYKRVRYKGIICDKCGVEVARSKVRRERMGHIELASPVTHIWFFKGTPSRIGLFLNISPRNLERVIYFAQYIVTRVDKEARERALERLDENIAAAVGQVDRQAQDRIDEIVLRIDEEAQTLAGVRDATYQMLEDQLASATDEIMNEATMLQANLQADQDRSARQGYVFGDEAIVDRGALVTTDHLNTLRLLAQARIEETEEGFRQKQEDNRLLIAAEIERLHVVTEEESSEIRARAAEEAGRARTALEEQRDDLQDLRAGQLLTESRHRELQERWGHVFQAGMGAEAIFEIMRNTDLDELAAELREEIHTTKGQRHRKATKRLRVVEALRQSGNRPEWMILTVLPVIPPELRPMVQLDGGRFATSDLNDLYRRVINRNNRLKRLLELGAPEIIVRNEKRMLQEAVDSLIDNGRRGRAVSGSRNHKLRSLSDMLRGKQGRFRQNLLGKRVDYSGRSVIIIGPDLKLHQCGLPKKMALELFKPFVMRKLVEHNYAHNIKSAKRIVERARPEVWDVLEEVTQNHPVLLNRAPTLHRLGIQAFEPVLVEGSAIQIHPLVCSAFNADFDGDQMAVHVPLSEAAQEEARVLMLSSRNLLLPSSGTPTIGPTKDMVLGCYYMTMARPGAKGEGKTFADLDEVLMAYQLGVVDIQAPIQVRWNGDLLQTTVGRVLFNMSLPEELQFQNQVMDKNKLRDLIATCHALFGPERTAQVADDIKDIGFRYATQSGTTIAIGDMDVPEDKARILTEATKQVDEIERHYRRGLITEDEKYTQTVEAWTSATEEITRAVVEHLDPFGPVHMMAVSGATKGQFQQIRQIAGMRGLMADPSGRIIDLPIRSNFREGLSVLEYFISTHGGRKGLADTALRTADSGYLTRRLVDVAQDVIIRAEDCGTEQGIWIQASEVKGLGASLRERTLGRWMAAPAVDPTTGQVLVAINREIDEEAAERIMAAGIEEVYVRSPLTCELPHGLCQFCYGRDLARGSLVEMGEAVGVIAAESIGEPGTQLTMRTFHTGGVAGTEDITQGLPRVEELFEARNPKGQALISDIEGVVELQREGDLRVVAVTSSEVFRDEVVVPRGYRRLVADGDEVTVDQPLAQWMQKGEVVKELVASIGGQVQVLEEGVFVRTADGAEVPHEVPVGYKRLVEDGELVLPGQVLAQRVQKGEVMGEVVAAVGGWFHSEPERFVVRHEERETREYEIPPAARLRVKTGDRIQAGERITEGSKSPREVLRIQGRDTVQKYLVNEIQSVYRSQGVNVNDKHIEIIVRQMLRKVQVDSSGDTELLPGELVDRFVYEEVNAKTMAEGGEPATAQTVLLGVTKAALNTESFLSAASFQETTRVLTEAAIQGKTDRLRGLKENVIIGKLIPAGSGVRRISPHLPSPTEIKALKEEQRQALLDVFGGVEEEETTVDDALVMDQLGLDIDDDEDDYDDLLEEDELEDPTGLE